MRKSGILLSISSLPGKYGIGCFSKEAYEFVDYLKKAGQSYWQILPMGPTSFGDSPYQSFSAFAGNPYFIDLDGLREDGLLIEQECKDAEVPENGKIDYAQLYNTRYKLLQKAFSRFDPEKEPDYYKFLNKEKYWLEDYALFMALKSKYLGKPYWEWEDEYRLHKTKALEAMKVECEQGIKFMCFLQYYFMKQWKPLKKYANKAGIEIVGDIPIYVAADSADVWANPKLFKLDENYIPTNVAGCPPDCFSELGQLWGNPIYDWDYHKKTGYEWWIKRMKASFKLLDVVRIDHFRGFDSYYSIPYGEETAVNGVWEIGPGYDLFKAVKKELGDVKVIAEDLGFLTKSVRKLVRKCEYPGMKILEFAFDGNPANEYLPHNYSKDYVVYTGTHDNETVVGWAKNLSDEAAECIKEYLHVDSLEEINWDLIRLAESSVARTAIIPLQDVLGLDNEARMNTPSTLGGNWIWRVKKKQLTDKDAKRLYRICKFYGRV